jgi:hypothetical protein
MIARVARLSLRLRAVWGASVVGIEDKGTSNNKAKGRYRFFRFGQNVGFDGCGLVEVGKRDGVAEERL